MTWLRAGKCWGDWAFGPTWTSFSRALGLCLSALPVCWVEGWLQEPFVFLWSFLYLNSLRISMWEVVASTLVGHSLIPSWGTEMYLVLTWKRFKRGKSKVFVSETGSPRWTCLHARIVLEGRQLSLVVRASPAHSKELGLNLPHSKETPTSGRFW